MLGGSRPGLRERDWTAAAVPPPVLHHTSYVFGVSYVEEQNPTWPHMHRVFGIVFARGPAVAVLILLESNGETYAVLTEQVRVPIGKFLLEPPAGMLDDEKGDFVGTAVHEVEEETGIKLNIEDMVDLMTLLDPATGGRMLPSPDECYDPATLVASSAWDVAKLRARFCVPSTPLEDTQCCDLHAGVRLCVSCSLDDVNLKFYDVVLDSWSDGPHTGSMEETGIERVCCVQSSPVQDPVLIEFLDGVTKLVGDANGETMSQEIHAAPAAEGGVPANAPLGFQRKFGSNK
uniref:Nudix hydrolase domain-containing protein n=1 Tax=Zea mays TaxID=4577 RepID=A0A804MV65_MAIZE